MRSRTTISHSKKLLLAAAALLALPASAAEPLGWSDVIAWVDRHPALRAARSDAEAARAGIGVATRVPRPTLSASLADARPSDARATEEAVGREWGLELSLPLDWLVRIGATGREASALARASRYEAEATRRAVVEEMGVLYWGLAHDQAVLEALVEAEAQVGDLARLVHLKVDRGEARPIEADRIDADLERLGIRRDAAEQEAVARRAQLASWLGTSPASLEVRSEDSLPPIPSSEEVIARVEAYEPAVRAEASRLEAARASLGVERRAVLPGVSARVFRESELDAELSGAGLEVELPLWGWNLSGLHKARAELEAAEARRDAVASKTRADLLSLHGRCAAGKQAVDRYEARILPKAERALETMERTFQVGQTGLMDLLDTRRLLTETRQELEQARLDSRVACTALLARIGAFDE